MENARSDRKFLKQGGMDWKEPCIELSHIVLPPTKGYDLQKLNAQNIMLRKVLV